MLHFYKNKDKQFLCGYNILTEGVSPSCLVMWESQSDGLHVVWKIAIS